MSIFDMTKSGSQWGTIDTAYSQTIVLSRTEAGKQGFGVCTNLLGAIEERVPYIPAHAIANRQPPRQGWLIQIDEQADGQIAE